MKKVMKCLMILIISLQLCGCSTKNYEADGSFETDVKGEYIYSIHGSTDSGNTYDLDITFQLNENNSYIRNTVENNSTSSDSGTYKIEDINNDLQKIIFTTSKNTVYDLYKYKNMLGEYYKIDDIPATKTFDLIIPIPSDYSPNGGMVFSKDGHYHACTDTKNCDCDYGWASYIMKNNIIYLCSDGSDNDFYSISFYVVEGGLFSPSAKKKEVG